MASLSPTTQRLTVNQTETKMAMYSSQDLLNSSVHKDDAAVGAVVEKPGKRKALNDMPYELGQQPSKKQEVETPVREAGVVVISLNDGPKRIPIEPFDPASDPLEDYDLAFCDMRTYFLDMFPLNADPSSDEDESPESENLPPRLGQAWDPSSMKMAEETLTTFDAVNMEDTVTST